MVWAMSAVGAGGQREVTVPMAGSSQRSGPVQPSRGSPGGTRLMVAICAGVLVLAGTGWLWWRHGAEVFAQMIVAGLAACF